MKYIRVMDGIKSNAGGFDYRIDEVNIAEKWDVSVSDPEQMGGFNFGTEDKILRWIHRGDTIYDVIIPDDAEVIICDEEKGIYRSNKIIVTNHRIITDENNEVKFIINWEWLYGKLELGSYRILKEVGNKYISIEFGIATTS